MKGFNVLRRVRWGGWLPRAGGAIASLIYPPRCAWCADDAPAASARLCDDCRQRLAPARGGSCGRCSAPLAAGTLPAESCAHCCHERFAWERAVTLGRYQGDLSQAVVRAKSPHTEALAFSLADLLLERRGEAIEQLQADVIIPVAMHWSRRWRRGTNSADLLAELLARRLRLPLRTRWLKRSRLTRPQTELSRAQRQRNQRNSFRLSRRARVEGKRVLLVDDVLTTGATADAAARAILAAGATAVVVAAIARAVGEDVL